MRKFEFLDTSLRDGEQTQELISLSKKRLPLPNNWKNGAFLLLKQVFLQLVLIPSQLFKEIAKVLTKTAVTGLARSVKSDIDACYEALKDAKYP